MRVDRYKSEYKIQRVTYLSIIENNVFFAFHIELYNYIHDTLIRICVPLINFTTVCVMVYIGLSRHLETIGITQTHFHYDGNINVIQDISRSNAYT